MVRKTKRKKSGIRIYAVILLLSIVAVFVYKSILVPENHLLAEKADEVKTSSYAALERIPEPAVAISADRLNSPNAMLVRLSERAILLQKNSEEKIYPASLTKMMTAISAM